MQRHIKQKWRPPLALVIGGTLAAFLSLPLIGIGYFRVAGDILGWGETAWLFFWLAVIATTILGFLLWRLVLRPVYALTAHANAVREGRTDAPLPPHFGTPEITALGQAVLEMGTTLQDREAGLRAYTNQVTHELKSPLTSLFGASELLSDETSPEERARLIQTIRNAAMTLQNQIDALRTLAAARDPLGQGPARLSEAVRLVEGDIGLPINLHEDAILFMDVKALMVILTHLAQNAKAHGATQLLLTSTDSGFRAKDDGRGIAAGNRQRVFDPFFTTRRAEGGTGMGLTIVQAMLAAAGGHITLGPAEDGATFDITLPKK